MPASQVASAPTASSATSKDAGSSADPVSSASRAPSDSAVARRWAIGSTTTGLTPSCLAACTASSPIGPHPMIASRVSSLTPSSRIAETLAACGSASTATRASISVGDRHERAGVDRDGVGEDARSVEPEQAAAVAEVLLAAGARLALAARHERIEREASRPAGDRHDRLVSEDQRRTARSGVAAVLMEVRAADPGEPNVGKQLAARGLRLLDALEADGAASVPDERRHGPLIGLLFCGEVRRRRGGQSVALRLRAPARARGRPSPPHTRQTRCRSGRQSFDLT